VLIGFSIDIISAAVSLGSTHSLTDVSTRNLPASKGRPVHEAANLTVLSEPIVYIMWEF
jgi:hypothetical protein